MNARYITISSLLSLFSAQAAAQQTQLVSVDSFGAQTASLESNGQGAISESGRYVAFLSVGPSLVPGDTNNASDIFVYDRSTGVTVRVSVDDNGVEANSDSGLPAISADGRYVAFVSDATNLDPAATNGFQHVFVHDRDFDGDGRFDQTTPGARRTVLVSKDATGVQGDADSSSCPVPTFNGPCSPSISGDGRYVAFGSDATNLDPSSNDTNNLMDVFVHDRDRDGNGIFDEVLGVGTTRAAIPLTPAPHPNGESANPSLAAGATVVVFDTAATDFGPVDVNGARDVIAWDFAAQTFTLHSVTTAGAQGNGASLRPSVSADGRFIAFLSNADNFSAAATPGYFDVFIHNRDFAGTGTFDTPGNIETRLVTHDPAGQGIVGFHAAPDVSDSGEVTVFPSTSSQLVAGDTNGSTDVFCYSYALDANVRASVGPTGAEANFISDGARVSGDGCTVSFTSTASNLVAADANGFTPDVFVRECPRSTFGAFLYCTGKTSSAGCVPFLSTTGCASVSDPDPFQIIAQDVVVGQVAELVYGVSKASLNYHCGKLCVKLPYDRISNVTPKNHGAGCTPATLSVDFNARIQSGVNPILTIGQTISAQYLQVDPTNSVSCPATYPDSLTDAVRFTIAP